MSLKVDYWFSIFSLFSQKMFVIIVIRIHSSDRGEVKYAYLLRADGF